MELLKEITVAVVELLKVKSIITIAIILAMVYMAVTGIIEPATFMTVAGGVVTYYFNRNNGNGGGNGGNGNSGNVNGGNVNGGKVDNRESEGE